MMVLMAKATTHNARKVFILIMCTNNYEIQIMFLSIYKPAFLYRLFSLPRFVHFRVESRDHSIYRLRQMCVFN